MTTHHDHEYLKLVQYTLDHGVHKSNRTGVDTIGIFGYQMRFDLRNGTIPLLTTKKMYTRAVIHEILWYLKGSDNIKYLKDNNVTIWDEWASPEGHLNKVYGFQWRKWEINDWETRVVEVPMRKGGVDAPFVVPVNEILTPQVDHKDILIGQRLQTNKGDWFTVISKISKKGEKNSRYLVQFEKTTSVVEVLRPNLKRGQVADPYKITVFGQGCVGNYKEKPKYYNTAYNLWYNMMRRCYDETSPEYYLYGARGIFVDRDWRCFENFLRDIHNLVYFTRWTQRPSMYDLDKDYFLGNCYSKETCIFLPSKYNQVLPKLDGSKYVAINRDTGQKHEFTVQRWFAKQHNIKHSQIISTALKSNNKQTQKWIFKKIEPKEGHVFRQQLFVDQSAELINKLKESPNDRRMIVSAWNVADLPTMALPPCHYTFQLYTKPLTAVQRSRLFTQRFSSIDLLDGIRENGPQEISAIMADIDKKFDDAGVPKYELSLLLNQRSCDIFLGVPFNIVQYSILLRMFCEVANMVPGELIWSGGDVHIYQNHIEQLKLQLTREPFPSPTLSFTRKVDDIDNFKYEDFVIENYSSHPTIKGDVAV